MPELPDVEMFRREAGKAANNAITDIVVTDNKIVANPPANIIKTLKKKRIQSADRRGKYLFLNTGNESALIMHFGMTGSVKYLSLSDNDPPYTMAEILLDNNHKPCYISQRKLGFIALTDNIDKFFRDKNIGNDIMDTTEDEFIKRMHQKRGSIKSVLTDQSLFSGIGNIYADEILFHAGLYPKKNAGKISKDKLGLLYGKTFEILEKAIKNGAAISNFPEDWLLPHRKTTEKCPQCGGKIKKIKVSGRSTYYCSACQKK